MRGVYEANFQWAALTTAQTMLTHATTAAICAEILSASITDVNNTTNQQMEAYFQRTTNALAGTGVATAVPSKSEVGDQAAASTLITGSSSAQTEPTYTVNTKIGFQGFASLAGYQYAPVPEERPVIPPSAFMGLKVNTTGTSTAWDVAYRFREVG